LSLDKNKHREYFKTMSKVGDLSFARPGGAALKAAGYTGVMRYFSHDTGKNLSHDELVDYLNNGLDVGVCWESTATRGLSGAAAGAQDGADALAQAQAVGYTGKIYATFDFDANDAQKPTLAAYQDAFSKAVGSRAAYGGYWVIKYLFDNGHIDYGWQTLAWSGGNVDPRAQLYQNGQSDFNGGVDVNDVKKADFGQMGHNSTPTPSPAPAPQPQPAPSADTYTVVSGDTLSGIAARFGTTYQALAALNGIADPNKINVGQVLKLHGGGAPVANGQTYTVVSGDTLSAIGARFGVDYHVIAQVNGITDPNKIYAGQVLRIPGTNVPAAAPAHVTYTVQKGDTLSGIASKYGTTYQHLAQINGISNPNVIYPGQVLRVS
jgi:LysM repeat protein